jgi:hypothetical protein
VPTAACLIRDLPHYRREAFVEGLRRAGYTVLQNGWGKADLFVTWNRHGLYDKIAKEYEQRGKPVLVVENGWLGKDADGRQLYSIAGTHHNGAGVWSCGEEDRWAELDVELKSWRTTGDHILVLAQRSIGPAGVAMPVEWTASVFERLRRLTKRPIKIRRHPGKERPPLEPDLENCWAAVTWGSGAGIKAITAGIPVFHEMPNWIGAPAARRGINDLENPFLGDRLPMLRRLAWHQWRISEIASGKPFEWLLK